MPVTERHAGDNAFQVCFVILKYKNISLKVNLNSPVQTMFESVGSLKCFMISSGTFFID